MASVPADDVRVVAAATGRTGSGSACEIAFVSAEALDRSTVSVKPLWHSFTQDRPVWMAAARTRAKLQPVKQMHWSADFLSDSLDAAGSPARVTRDAAGRALAVAGVRVAVIASDKVVWTLLGVRTFEATIRRDAESRWRRDARQKRRRGASRLCRPLRPPRAPAPQGRTRARGRRARAHLRDWPPPCADRAAHVRIRGRSLAAPPRGYPAATLPPRQPGMGRLGTRITGARSGTLRARLRRVHRRIVVRASPAEGRMREVVFGGVWCCARTLDAGSGRMMLWQDIYPTSWNVCPGSLRSMWSSLTLYAQHLGSVLFRGGLCGDIGQATEVARWHGACGDLTQWMCCVLHLLGVRKC